MMYPQYDKKKIKWVSYRLKKEKFVSIYNVVILSLLSLGHSLDNMTSIMQYFGVLTSLIYVNIHLVLLCPGRYVLLSAY
jgi:hypothetical protein